MTNQDSTSFLSLVAKDLVFRFGNRLADVTVVFPSRRARLFFNNYLYRGTGSPLWAPQYVTIEELFESHSSYQNADTIQLSGDLFQSYLEVYQSTYGVPSTETLDEFFFFGEILLNDFNDIDKNLVNARGLFSNLKDLDRLKDDFGHLSEVQLESISRHFGMVFNEDSKLKNAFWSIWNILGDVYQSFREKLKERGKAYQGMIMRDVIENESLDFSDAYYVFVGFNVLNKCEESLFKKLKNKALFYWDYDEYYLNHEAGRFITENIRKFGSALGDIRTQTRQEPCHPSDAGRAYAERGEYEVGIFNSFLGRDKEITFFASSSESGQTGIIPSWINSLNHSPDYTAPDSAIVLCNESILPVVMHAISPEKVENVNITMGFPITQTPISDFLQILAELQTQGTKNSNGFYYKYVLQTLRHPYTRVIFPKAKDIEEYIQKNNIFYPDNELLDNELIFAHTLNATDLGKYLLDIVERLGKTYKTEASFQDVYDGLYQESIFRAYQILNRLYGLMLSGDLTLEKPTFLRLLRRMLSATQVPFHGEPVKGLQIMGVLETRTLDFKNLLILSANEGFMPGSNSENTFIPKFLRSHLGLNTIEHQDSIYAYYFYRLLQRAEKISIVYSTDKTQTGKAEMSRFLLQMLVDPQLKIRRFTLQSIVKPMEVQPVVVQKTDEVIRLIKEKYDFNTNPAAKAFTPSNLNTFIDCSLRFYFQKIKGYETPDELSDELDTSVFGTIFHRAAEFLYREIESCSRHCEGEARSNLPPSPLKGERRSLFRGGAGGEVLDCFAPLAMTTTSFVVQKERLDAYLQPESNYRIRRLVSKAFDEVYFKGKPVDESKYNGEQLINFRVICKMLERLIAFDRRRAPFTILGLECKEYVFFELPEYDVKLKIGGIIDRIEVQNGKILIIDYKTGGSGKTCKTLEELVMEKDKRASHIFQTFVYASVLIKKNSFDLPVIPALLYMQDAGKEDFSPIVECDKEQVEDFRKLNDAFEELYIQKASDLFNQDIPFKQTTFESNCVYCEFRELCNR